jgi:hypothetical protein
MARGGRCAPGVAKCRRNEARRCRDEEVWGIVGPCVMDDGSLGVRAGAACDVGCTGGLAMYVRT